MIQSVYISIKDFLANQGILPTKEMNGYGMYLSPLRDEKTASFKVDYDKNLWYDFGTGEGGSIIDLVMKLENCSIGDAIAKLKDNSSFSFHSRELPKRPQANVQPTIQITSIKPLQNIYLVGYLQYKRSINLDIAKEYCQEVHYTINGKPYFAIGFKSDAGGWELRNEYFKGSTSPKGVTTIQSGSPTCLLFEGFIDMLSYLTLKKVGKPPVDIVVLNSVNNLNKATDFLGSHEKIDSFLDNDEAGNRTLALVKKLGIEVNDYSSFYRNNKDLNEYLCKTKVEPKASIIKSKRMRM